MPSEADPLRISLIFSPVTSFSSLQLLMVYIMVKNILLAAVALLFLNNSLAASISRQANVWEGRCPQKNTTLKPNRYPFDPCRKGFNELFPESEWLLSHALTFLFFQKPPTFNGFYTLAWNWDLLVSFLISLQRLIL